MTSSRRGRPHIPPPIDRNFEQNEHRALPERRRAADAGPIDPPRAASALRGRSSAGDDELVRLVLQQRQRFRIVAPRLTA